MCILCVFFFEFKTEKKTNCNPTERAYTKNARAIEAVLVMKVHIEYSCTGFV